MHHLHLFTQAKDWNAFPEPFPINYSSRFSGRHTCPAPKIHCLHLKDAFLSKTCQLLEWRWWCLSPHLHSRIELSEEVFLSAILDKALPRKDTLPDAERRLRVPCVHTESTAWGLKIAGSSTNVRAKSRKHILIHPRHLPRQRHNKSIHPQSRYRTRMIRSQRGPAGTPNNLLTETCEQPYCALLESKWTFVLKF